MPIFYNVKRMTQSENPSVSTDGRLFEVATRLNPIAAMTGTDEALRDLARAYLLEVYPGSTSSDGAAEEIWWWRGGAWHLCEKVSTVLTIPDPVGQNPILVEILVDKHAPFGD
jgi:hypothetical protein